MNVRVGVGLVLVAGLIGVGWWVSTGDSDSASLTEREADLVESFLADLSPALVSVAPSEGQVAGTFRSVCSSMDDAIEEAGGPDAGFRVDLAYDNEQERIQTDLMFRLVEVTTAGDDWHPFEAEAEAIVFAATVVCPEHERLARHLFPPAFGIDLSEVAVSIQSEINPYSRWIFRSFLWATFRTEQAMDTPLDGEGTVRRICAKVSSSLSPADVDEAAGTEIRRMEELLQEQGVPHEPIDRGNPLLYEAMGIDPVEGWRPVLVSVALVSGCPKHLAEWHELGVLDTYATVPIWNSLYADRYEELVADPDPTAGTPPTAEIEIIQGTFRPFLVEVIAGDTTEVRFTNTDDGTRQIESDWFDAPDLAPGDSWILDISDWEPGFYRFNLLVGNAKAVGSIEISEPPAP